MDPRLSAIPKRLERVERILAIVSGKGGVGKTLISSAMALYLARRRLPVGLLDLDLTNPSCHLVLGLDVLNETPVENMGVLPVTVHGLKFMTVAFYTCGEALPLRGGEVDDVFREILAVTRWGGLKALIVDTPPGFGDVILNISSHIPRAEFIAVTTLSPLSLEALRRLGKTHLASRVIGVAVNKTSKLTAEKVRRIGFKVLCEIPYYPNLEACLGNVDKLLETDFARRVGEMGLSVLSRGLGFEKLL